MLDCNRFIILFTQIIHQKQTQKNILTLTAEDLEKYSVTAQQLAYRAQPHLWKCTTWSFVCRGLTVYGLRGDSLIFVALTLIEKCIICLGQCSLRKNGILFFEIILLYPVGWESWGHGQQWKTPYSSPVCQTYLGGQTLVFISNLLLFEII